MESAFPVPPGFDTEPLSCFDRQPAANPAGEILQCLQDSKDFPEELYKYGNLSVL